MKSTAALLLLLIAACTRPAQRAIVAPAAVPAAEAANPPVGGVILSPGATLAAHVATAPSLAVFRSITSATDVGASLAGPGPITVFAPTNEAFGRLAPGTAEALVKPENRATLVRLVTLHIVAERVTGSDLVRRIGAGGGRATLASVAGEQLVLTMTGDVVTLTDTGGNRSYVEIADVRAANGVMHVVNGVLVPRSER